MTLEMAESFGWYLVGCAAWILVAVEFVFLMIYALTHLDLFKVWKPPR